MREAKEDEEEGIVKRGPRLRRGFCRPSCPGSGEIHGRWRNAFHTWMILATYLVMCVKIA